MSKKSVSQKKPGKNAKANKVAQSNSISVAEHKTKQVLMIPTESTNSKQQLVSFNLDNQAEENPT